GRALYEVLDRSDRRRVGDGRGARGAGDLLDRWIARDAVAHAEYDIRQIEPSGDRREEKGKHADGDEAQRTWPVRGRLRRRNGLFFFQAEDGIRDGHVTGVQTCALPISTSCRWNATGLS